jgi:hypothetical protein
MNVTRSISAQAGHKNARVQILPSQSEMRLPSVEKFGQGPTFERFCLLFVLIPVMAKLTDQNPRSQIGCEICK